MTIAGENKFYAEFVAEALGGACGLTGLRLNAFLDKSALQPGDHADKVWPYQ